MLPTFSKLVMRFLEIVDRLPDASRGRVVMMILGGAYVTALALIFMHTH